jgi:chromosome segregation ATPase
MAILNELLAEASSRAVALSNEAQEATGIVDEVREQARSLAETLDDEADEAHERFQHLQSKLEAARDELDGAGDKARGGLQAVGAKAAAVQARIDALAATLAGELTQFDGSRDGLLATFDQEVRTATAGFEHLAQQTAKVRDGAEKSLQQAAEAVAHLRSVVAEGREEMARGKQGLLDAMDALESAAREQAQLYVQAMGRALTAQTATLFDLDRRLKDAHNATMVPLRRTFAEESVARLSASSVLLRAALESLGGLCGDYEEPLLEECTQVLARFEQAAGTLGRTQALLQAADRLA